jgi:hypothetical protein
MATLSVPTLQQLLTSTRRLLNQPRESNSFWKDDELTEYLNEAVSMYFLECVQVNEGYFTTTANLNIVSGAVAIALPSDTFQIKNVYKKVTNGYALLSYNNSVTDGLSDLSTTGDSYLPAYKFRGNELILNPTPSGNETAGIRIEYIQFPDQMVWGGDSMTAQVSPIFKQLITMYAVYKAKLRESMVNNVATYTAAEKNLGELYGMFKDNISRRSRNPTYVVPFNPENI